MHKSYSSDACAAKIYSNFSAFYKSMERTLKLLQHMGNIFFFYSCVIMELWKKNSIWCHLLWLVELLLYGVRIRESAIWLKILLYWWKSGWMFWSILFSIIYVSALINILWNDNFSGICNFFFLNDDSKLQFSWILITSGGTNWFLSTYLF